MYPLGYRSAALAVFAGLIKLWCSDRQAAEAVLLHEIAHYRSGDTHIIGTGSFFEWLMKSWLFVYLMFVCLPLVATTIDMSIQTIQDLHQIDQLTNPNASLLPAIVQVIQLDLPNTLLGLVILLLVTLFWFAATLAFPLAAIWCAELSADQFVVERKCSPDALARALTRLPVKVSPWRWLLFRMSHPPDRVRRWILLQSQGTEGSLRLLLLFPLAFFIRLLALVGWALSAYLSSVISGHETWNHVAMLLTTDIKFNLEAFAPQALAIAVLFLLWPAIEGYWQRFFGGKKSLPNSFNYTYHGYCWSTIILACLSVLCYSLYFLGK